MRDDRDVLVLNPRGPNTHGPNPHGQAAVSSPACTPAAPVPSSAVIIPFPGRGHAVRGPAAVAANLLECVASILNPLSAAHAPTHLAALGALAGFAAQQSLLVAGAAVWAQPARAGHLDRLLLSPSPADASLWFGLRTAAESLGARNLPDPYALADSALRCVGTNQLGQITLPLEYRLLEQPQSTLVQLWPQLRTTLSDAAVPPAQWPALLSAVAVRRVALEQRQMPVPVALRVVMQAALAMALIEPRIIPAALGKPASA